MRVENLLKQFGLQNEEAQIYVYLLKHTEGTAFQIARDTKIPRTTVYAKLESLKGQGLISSFKKNNVLHYTPESITRLEAILREKESVLQELLPDLKSLINSSAYTPGVKMFTGIEGMKIVLEDMLETMSKEKTKVLYATALPELIDYLPRYFPNWLKQREKMGIFTKLIMNHTDRKEINQVFATNEKRETRFLPPHFPFHCTMDIYGNKIAFFSLKQNEVYSVIIDSPTITEMFKNFFLFTWEMLGKK